MPDGDRVSAFAKRRRLNNGIATPVEDLPPLSIDQVSKPLVKTSREKDRNRSPASISLHRSNFPDDNTFLPLVEASAVNYSGTREIETLSDKCTKIRLSQGQKCLFTGAALLWIREGSVTVYGATLHESSNSHTVYAPSTHALPSIIALSKSAEIQLESVEDVQPYFAFEKFNPWRAKSNSNSLTSSFTLIGIVSKETDLDERRPAELDFSSIRHLLMRNEAILDRLIACTGPRIILCGRNATTMSASSTAILNHLLTLVDHTGKSKYPEGILFLDLDILNPEFGVPATVSLAQITTPIFGPSFSHPLTALSKVNYIKDARFVGTQGFGDFNSIHSSIVTSLLAPDSGLRNLPLVVKVRQHLDTYQPHQDAEMWTELQPDIVIDFDKASNAQSSSVASAIAEIGQCPVVTAATRIDKNISAELESQLQIQSYFHVLESLGNRTVWSREPVLNGGQKELTLKYGEYGKGLSFIVLDGGCLSAELLAEALDRSLVFIVTYASVVEKDGKGNSVSEARSLPVERCSSSEFGIGRLLADDIEPMGLPCLGLGIVSSVNEEAGHISVVTPVPKYVLERASQDGAALGLILPKSRTDGRFSDEWYFREMNS